MNFATTLQQIKGIGPVRGKRLFEAGFDSYHKILQADEKELKAVRGMGEYAVTILLNEAREVTSLHELLQADATQPASEDLKPLVGQPDLSTTRVQGRSPWRRNGARLPSPTLEKSEAANEAAAANGIEISASEEATSLGETPVPGDRAAAKRAPRQNRTGVQKGATTRKKATSPRQAAPNGSSGPQQVSSAKATTSSKKAPGSKRTSVAKRVPIAKEVAHTQQNSAVVSAPTPQGAHAPQRALVPRQAYAPQLPQAPQQVHGMQLRLSQLQERIGNLAQSARSRYSSQLDCRSGRRLSVEIATIETALISMHESGAEWPARTARALVKVEKRIDGLEDASLKKFCKRFKKARKAVIKGLP